MRPDKGVNIGQPVGVLPESVLKKHTNGPLAEIHASRVPAGGLGCADHQALVPPTAACAGELGMVSPGSSRFWRIKESRGCRPLTGTPEPWSPPPAEPIYNPPYLHLEDYKYWAMGPRGNVTSDQTILAE